jgi:SAM-dependent methyltransferase
MTLSPEESARLRALNEDHHVRMRADYGRHQKTGALETLLRNDELSREHLVQAMLNCERRCEMRDDWAYYTDPSRPAVPQLLELGAGSGRDASYLEERLNADYYGIDVVPEVFQGDRDRFTEISVENMPDEWEGRFRYVYSRHVMEHVLNADRALQRLKKVLRPDGIIGAVTPHLFPDNEPAHVTKLRVEEWHAAYERNGFRVVYCPVLQFNCPEVVLVAIHQEWDWPPTKD